MAKCVWTYLLHGFHPERAVLLRIPQDDVFVIGAGQEQALVGVDCKTPALIGVCLEGGENNKESGLEKLGN